jgi:predicted Zn-dependent peptidase
MIVFHDVARAAGPWGQTMKKNFLLVSVVAWATLAAQEPPAAPQPQQSLKGVVRKNLAPVSSEVLRVKFPRPYEKKLKNGLTLLVIERGKLPTVDIDLVLPASTLRDPADLPGVAELTAEMLRLGTAKRSAREISETLSELGASLNIVAQYGSRSTHLYVSTLSENLDQVLDIMADVLLSPAFPQDELDKLKSRYLSRLQMQRSQEFFLANERLHQLLYPDDLRKHISATPEAIRKITREHLVEYWKSLYRPGSSILGATGDIAAAEFAKKIEGKLAGWEPGVVAEPKLKLEEPLQEKKIYLINRPNSVQSLLYLTNRAIWRLHPDYVTVQVLNRILGGGPAGRLFMNLREEKGFTYGAYSGYLALQHINHMVAMASVRTEVTGPALQEFLNEFQRMREEPTAAEELENAKRAIVANFALGLESQQGVLRQLLLLREYGLPADYWDTYPAKIMAVTASDVQRVSKKYVPFDNVQIIVVGDGNKTRETLAKFGPIEEYSTEGVRVEERRGR